MISKKRKRIKFKRRKAFMHKNAINKLFGLAPYRSWGKKKIKWESYNLKKDEVKTIDYFDMFGYEDEVE